MMNKWYEFRHRRDQDEFMEGIHKAAAQGKVAKVERFLALRSEDLNAQDFHYRTPLHWACERGHVKVVMLLLNRDCEVDSRDKDRRTPLMLEGMTPLFNAIHWKIQKAMICLLKNHANINVVDNSGRTVLMVAAKHGTPDMVKILLKHNVKLFAEDTFGKHAEDYAISHGSTKILQQIMERKKDILANRNLDARSADESAVSVLHDPCVDSCSKPEDEGLTVATKQCVPKKLSKPLPGPSHEKRNSVVNGKGEGPPAKQASLKPTTEVEDSAMNEAVQRKNVQTTRAVASEEEQERLERSEKKQPQVKERRNTKKSKKIKLSENMCDNTSSDAAAGLAQQRKIKKIYPQQFPKKVKEEHDGCTLKQENEDKSNDNKLYKTIKEAVEKGQERYMEEVKAKQQLELTVQSLEMELKTLRNTQNQDFHNREKMIDMHKCGILKRDIAILRQEMDTIKKDSLKKENNYFENIKIIKERNAELDNYLKAELTRLNSELKEKNKNEGRLEAEIESYRSRLAAALSEHNQRVKTERDLKLSLQRTQDVSVQVKLSDISEVKDEYEFLREQLSEMRIKCNHLEERLFQHEKEKAEREVIVRQLQQELVDSLKNLTMLESPLEGTSCCHINLDETQSSKNKLFQVESQSEEEKEELRKLSVLISCLKNNVDQIRKKNDEVEKERTGYKKFLEMTKYMLNEFGNEELGFHGDLTDQLEMDILIKKVKYKFDDLTEELGAVSSKCLYLAKNNQVIQQELISMEDVQQKYENFKEVNKTLEQEVVNLKTHMEKNMVELSEVEEYKLQIETARQERKKLEEIGLQKQAEYEKQLEQLQKNNMASDAKYRFSKMKTAYKEVTTELEEYKEAFVIALKANRHMSKKLKTSQEKLAIVSSRLQKEKEQMKSFLSILPMRLDPELPWIGSVNSMGLSRNY
ncbi:putative ankyrin repeat domain-containing protein 20A3 isoform X3 [Aotus nancymaae]|uniref:putative ankyrin repeat domain-containing protein 20A3 isoform X3 n=1 Tax=Aotus nancymaae TaxID=37293 RepID=UPI0030FF06FA